MAYSSPATVSDGNVAPATWGNSVKAAVDYLANPPQCRAGKSVVQAIGTGVTNTPVTFDTEEYDTAAIHSTVSLTDRFVAPANGVYHCDGFVSWQASAAGSYRQVRILKNGAGVAIHSHQPSSVHSGETTVTCDVKLTIGDVVNMVVNQDSGGNLNINTECRMSVRWVGLG